MKYHLIWPRVGVDKRYSTAYGHGRWKPSFASRFDLAYGAAYALALYTPREALLSVAGAFA